MKIVVAGKEVADEWGSAVKAQAMKSSADPRCLFLPWFLNALSLRGAKNERAYLDRFLELVRYKNHVDTIIFDIPRKQGLFGLASTLFKKIAWKLLRYQHDRVTFRQNLVNSHVVRALEFERDLMVQEVEQLKGRLAELEKRLDVHRGH